MCADWVPLRWHMFAAYAWTGSIFVFGCLAQCCIPLCTKSSAGVRPVSQCGRESVRPCASEPVSQCGRESVRPCASEPVSQ